MRTYSWNPTFVLETVKLLITYLEFFRQNRSDLRVMSELLIGLSVYQLFFPHPQVGRKNFKLPLHHDTYWLIEHSFFAFIRNPLFLRSILCPVVASSEKFNILLYMPMCPVTFQISVYFVRTFLSISSAFSK